MSDQQPKDIRGGNVDVNKGVEEEHPDRSKITRQVTLDPSAAKTSDKPISEGTGVNKEGSEPAPR